MVKDGVDFIHQQEKAVQMERNWARFTNWIKNHPNQYLGGFHHQGMHWTEIYSVLPDGSYKPGVLRVAHFKLSPRHIKCLRKERLPGGIIRWVLSFHWEGHCPACQPPILIRRGPAKLLRRDNGRPKLLRREKNNE